MKRFLGHVLPSGFCRIRHYGFLASRAKAKQLVHCRKLLNVKTVETVKDESWQALMARLTGGDVTRCRHCKCGTLVRIATLHGERKWRNSS
jgi:hypothetical protein